MTQNTVFPSLLMVRYIPSSTSNLTFQRGRNSLCKSPAHHHSEHVTCTGNTSQDDVQGAEKAPVVTGEPATVQLLQPQEVQALGDEVAAPRGRSSEEDPVEAVATGGPDAQVGVQPCVPRVAAVLRPAQQLPDVRDAAG